MDNPRGILPQDFGDSPSIPMGTPVVILSKKWGVPLVDTKSRMYSGEGLFILYVTRYSLRKYWINDEQYQVVVYSCSDNNVIGDGGDHFVRSDLMLVSEISNDEFLFLLKEVDSEA
jgi:hypothetical protein